MTSPTYNAKLKAVRSELEIFNRLPRALRDVLNECDRTPPKASIVLDALLRGVSEEKIIETIERSQKS